jgi:hypothetical protein
MVCVRLLSIISLAYQLLLVALSLRQICSQGDVSKTNDVVLSEEFKRVRQDVQEIKTSLQEIKRKILQPSSSICPDGFVYFPSANRCYKLIQKALNWEDSRKECSSLYTGAHLASIETFYQNLALVDFIKSFNFKQDLPQCISQSFVSIYTGGQRINPADCRSLFIWKTSDTARTWLTYKNWGAGEPNCHLGLLESCLSLDEDKKFQWNDRVCSDLLCSVCEVNPGLWTGMLNTLPYF